MLHWRERQVTRCKSREAPSSPKQGEQSRRWNCDSQGGPGLSCKLEHSTATNKSDVSWLWWLQDWKLGCQPGWVGCGGHPGHMMDGKVLN